MQEKEKNKSIDLMEDSEEAAIRSCHQEPIRRNIVIAIACIKTLQLQSFTMLTSCICILENVSFLAESLDRRHKGKTQKKVVPFHLYTIHTKHVIITSEDIQVALQYTQWKSYQDENKNSISGAELKQIMVTPNLQAIPAKWVTIMLEDIQIAS